MVPLQKYIVKATVAHPATKYRQSIQEIRMPVVPRVAPSAPLTIKMHDHDNVAIVANDGGLAAGTRLPSGLLLRDRVPQGHTVALQDLPAGSAVSPEERRVGKACVSPLRSWWSPYA